MGQPKNKDESEPQSTQDGSMTTRKTLYTLDNQEGEVVAPEKTNFGMRPLGWSTRSAQPC